MTYSIEDLPNVTGYETSAYDFGRGLPSCPYGIYGPDFVEDGLWLPIEGVYAGDSYGASQLTVILNETNEKAALAIIDGYDEGFVVSVEREYHGGYWWVQVIDSEGVVNEAARGVLDEIAEALVNYSILDESAYSRREYEETAENLDGAITDELRDAPAGMWDEWEDIAAAAGMDLVDAIVEHEELTYESEDCWPRFYNCDVLAIAGHIIDTVIENNTNAAARVAHVERYGADPKQKDLF